MIADLLRLAERGLAHLSGEGQVTAVRERSQLARFAGSRPTTATDVDELEILFTVVRDGHTATATAPGADDEALRAAALRAERAAAAAAEAGPGAYPGLPAPEAASAASSRTSSGFDPDTAGLDPRRAGRALEEIFAATAPSGALAAGIWTAGAVETAIVSTTGVRAVDAVTDGHVKVLATGRNGRSGYAAATSTTSANLDAGAVAEAAVAKLSDEEPAELPPGTYPAVLEPAAVGNLLEFLGYLTLNGLAYAEGRSAFSERLETRVAAPGVNLSDSPRYRASLPRAFDAEGVPKAPLPLIQDGIANAVVHDTRSAALTGDGARSTGHALAPGGAPYGPVPTNLVLVGGGASSAEELAAPIRRGVYVTRLWYVNAIHPKQTLLTGMTRDGTFLIEDGRIGRPLRDVRFTDSILRLLACTEALAREPNLVCEAELYGRRFASGVVCPAVRVAELRVTSATL